MDKLNACLSFNSGESAAPNESFACFKTPKIYIGKKRVSIKRDWRFTIKRNFNLDFRMDFMTGLVVLITKQYFISCHDNCLIQKLIMKCHLV